jgi:hypothetical protein
MSKFDDLKKKQFVNKVEEYSEGIKASPAKRITLSMTHDYISLLNKLSQQERLAKSLIVRAALLKFSTLDKEEKESVYNDIFANKQ